jgi:hypothetical protein
MYPELLMTRETVMVETPASRATSVRVLTSLVAFIVRAVFNG